MKLFSFIGSSYFRNVSIMVLSTGLAQAIPFLISPFVYRSYAPEVIGVFTLYMSLLSVLVMIATGRMEQGLIRVDDENDKRNIVNLIIIVSVVVCLLSSLLVYLLSNFEFFEVPLYFSYLLPSGILLYSFYLTLYHLELSRGGYKEIAKSKLIQSSLIALLQVVLSYKFLLLGLIIAQVAGYLAALVYLLMAGKLYKYLYKGEGNNSKTFSKISGFPKYYLPQSLLNHVSNDLPIYFLTIYFSFLELSYLSLCLLVVSMPLGVISGSWGQVAYQRFSEAYSENSLKQVFDKTLRVLFMVSILGFITLNIFYEIFVGFLYGDRWLESVDYMFLIAPMLFVRFIGSILSSVVFIKDRQKTSLKIEVFSFFMRLLVLSICVDYGVEIMLLAYSSASVFVTMAKIKWYKQLVG